MPLKWKSFQTKDYFSWQIRYQCVAMETAVGAAIRHFKGAHGLLFQDQDSYQLKPVLICY